MTTIEAVFENGVFRPVAPLFGLEEGEKLSIRLETRRTSEEPQSERKFPLELWRKIKTAWGNREMPPHLLRLNPEAVADEWHHGLKGVDSYNELMQTVNSLDPDRQDGYDVVEEMNKTRRASGMRLLTREAGS